MPSFSSGLILTFCAVALAVGVFLVARSSGYSLWDSLSAKNIFKAKRKIKDFESESEIDLSDLEADESAFLRIVKRPTIWFVLGGLIGLALWDIILSPVAFTTVILIGGYFRSDRKLLESERLDSHVNMLFTTFNSHISSAIDVQTTLDKVQPSLPEGALKSATERIVAILRKKLTYRKAFYPWLLFDNPMLERFAFLLAGSDGVSMAQLSEYLDAFREYQIPWFEMRKKTRDSLNLVGLVGKILMLLTVASLVAAGIIPQWREFLSFNITRYLILLGALLVLIIFMLYYRMELSRLEEN